MLPSAVYDRPFIEKHKKIVNELQLPTEQDLDQLLVEMFNEAKANGQSVEFYKIAAKFVDLLLLCNNNQFAFKYMNIALTVYNLPINPVALSNYEMFHDKYGNYIVDLQKQIS